MCCRFNVFVFLITNLVNKTNITNPTKFQFQSVLKTTSPVREPYTKVNEKEDKPVKAFKVKKITDMKENKTR